MNQMKIGIFLQQLRKEKGLTQEQLAEMTGVARRTVSRWETGNNLPDLDILIKLSDLYAVDLRVLLDGKRKDKSMDKEMEETVLKVAEYSNAEKKRSTRIVRVFFVLGIIALIIYACLGMADLGDSFWVGFPMGITFGIALGSMLLGILYTTRALQRIQAFKMRLIRREGKE